MFIGNVMMPPGSEQREFAVLRPVERESENGRVLVNDYAPAGTVRAILARAKPDERERWKQLHHPVTHKIIMAGKPAFEIKPGDIFEQGGRRFYMQAIPYDIADMGHWTVFYCGERADVK